MSKKFTSFLLASFFTTVPAFAEDTTPVALSTPAMVGPLAANPKPLNFDVGELGKIYITGAITGLGLMQSNELTVDDDALADLNNGQIFIQKPDGLFQFYLQAGAYSLPSLGTPYMQTDDAIDNFYGLLPQAFVKLAPSSNFSIMAGKLPTLFGAEYTFTFENMNVERGLLWNQENAVNRGVQANYTTGPLALAISLNDGFYSGKYSWLTGSAAYTINGSNSISIYAGGNLDDDSKSTIATPLAQNNSQVYGVIYTYNTGKWTFNPYLQYTHVPKNTDIGIADDASTYGAALLTKYAFNSNFSIAGRAEYIDSSASVASPNLLYGPNSSAWSLTITPTYQYNLFFVRGEASYTKAEDAGSGFAFGSAGNNESQARFLVETGILF